MQHFHRPPKIVDSDGRQKRIRDDSAPVNLADLGLTHEDIMREDPIYVPLFMKIPKGRKIFDKQ